MLTSHLLFPQIQNVQRDKSSGMDIMDEIKREFSLKVVTEVKE